MAPMESWDIEAGECKKEKSKFPLVLALIVGFSAALIGGLLLVIVCAMSQQNPKVGPPAHGGHTPHRQQGGRPGRTPAQLRQTEDLRRMGLKPRHASKYKAPAHYCYGGNLVQESGNKVTYEQSQKIMNDLADESVIVDGQKWYDQMDVRDADDNGILDCDEVEKPASKKPKAKKAQKLS